MYSLIFLVNIMQKGDLHYIIYFNFYIFLEIKIQINNCVFTIIVIIVLLYKWVQSYLFIY